MILTAFIMMGGGIGGAWFASKASISFGADLREDCFKKVQQFSFHNIDSFSSGSLVTRLTNDITQVQNLIMMGLRMMLRAPGMFLGALVMAVLIVPFLFRKKASRIQGAALLAVYGLYCAFNFF